MTFQQLSSVDLNALSKAQLKSYVKVARQEWNHPIDLRSATSADMIEYLQMYLQFKAETDNAVVLPHVLSDFDGIEPEVMQITDWMNASPLTCDICGYQVCDLPQVEEVLAPKPVTTQKNAKNTTVTVSQGFGKIQKPALIKGWLLPENRKYCTFKPDAFVLESLPMLLNVWVAAVAGRRGVPIEKGLQGAIALLCELDQELGEKFIRLGQGDATQDEAITRFFKTLRRDDSAYITYNHKLLELVHTAIKEGKHGDLNGIIQNTWQYKEWMQEAGHLMTATKLINGIFHPLSEVKTIDDEQCLNFWACASLMAGVVTKRDNDGNPQKVLTTLIQLGVIDMESDYKMRLEVCRYIDAEYLKLISEIKEALDNSASIAA